METTVLPTSDPVTPAPEVAAPAVETQAPVGRQERVSAVDVLRGVSLLGILLMNILDFGLPRAYDDPTNAGGATGINLWTWFTVSVLFEGKMRAIFSMLFGAGLILMTSRADERGDARIADIWLRRNLWLLLIGAAHGYLLWGGDILYAYGLTGVLLYPFRKLSPKAMLIAGVLLLASQSPKSWVDGIETRVLKVEAELAQTVEGSKLPITDELKKAKEKWEEKRKSAKPDKTEIDKVIAQHRGSWANVARHRAGETLGWHTKGMYLWGLWDAAGMMLLGMALMKWGVLTAGASRNLYLAMMLIGYGIGIPVRAWACWYVMEAKFDMLAFSSAGLTYDLSRLTIAAGHVGLVMLVVQSGVLLWLVRRLAAVGQMALTNYLTHTLVCTTFFYGYGLGYYGLLQRHQLYYLVAAIWVAQLILSPVWLRHFQFGPAEWAWRSLTYWKRQPMRLEAAHG